VAPYDSFVERELPSWHKTLLPVSGNVVDMGAGCGETAFFFLQHGAESVTCFEYNPPALECLYANYGADPRVTIIPLKIGKIKCDIEGSEKGAMIETHFPARFRRLDRGTPSPRWILEQKRLTVFDSLRVKAEQMAYSVYRGITN